MQPLPVRFLPLAQTDLEDIYRFVAVTADNPRRAALFTDRIVDRAEKIGDAPYGGVARPDLGEGIRMVPFEKSAVILYTVGDEEVLVVNVFYGGKDYAAILNAGPAATD
ncbi:type II toxin-antitoxin system RelE/ParE family toxin [Fulvimarina sp. MAC8]|uniref:type II toxin-antitoxin system RelE/ParE family toxin n=1 Tax=Fulvimarina sp. MAC8 TaxID=3162874 RepID=UPI0032F03A65